MSDQKKPVFDEQTLAKLLEAAYVLQEHNRERRKSESGHEAKSNARAERAPSNVSAPLTANISIPPAASQHDYRVVLEKVVEAQRRMQAGHLSRHSALTLLAEQALDLAHGSGAAIAFLDGEHVHYEAVAGIAMMPSGAAIPVEDAMCAISVRTGEAFRCAEINPAILPDIEECRRSGVQAFIVVPIFLQEKVAGAIEVYYSQPQAFSEQDVHGCQLIAGLVPEVPARNGQPAARSAAAANSTGSPATVKPVSAPALPSSRPNFSLCQSCGHELLEHEHFCVECGARRSDVPPSTDRAMPEEDAAVANSSVPPAITNHDLSWAASLKDQIPDLFAAAESNSDLESWGPDPSEAKSRLAEEELVENKTNESSDVVEETPASQSLAISKPQVTADWSSASSAREFLEQLAGGKRRNAVVRLWNERRGDIYLALAVLLVACVIRWGLWSNPSVRATAAAPNSTAAHQKSPDADLSVFDRLLITLGLAEAPEPAADNGNPSAQVWIDLHTALYYCQGSDMYGKTATGKYATQRDAQLDSFEPAYRKVCE